MVRGRRTVMAGKSYTTYSDNPKMGSRPPSPSESALKPEADVIEDKREEGGYWPPEPIEVYMTVGYAMGGKVKKRR
jgi:hypothetical protein